MALAGQDGKPVAAVPFAAPLVEPFLFSCCDDTLAITVLDRVRKVDGMTSPQVTDSKASEMIKDETALRILDGARAAPRLVPSDGATICAIRASVFLICATRESWNLVFGR